MKENFADATAKILQTHPEALVIAVNGCCYGQEANPNKGNYFKYCGQHFWSFISGVDELYTQIIEPLGYKAKDKNEAFWEEYAKIVTNFIVEFANEFCEDGKIDWVKLVEFNSSRSITQLRERRKRYSI